MRDNGNQSQSANCPSARIYARPRPQGHCSNILPAGALKIMVEQCCEIGGGRGRGHPDERHFRGMAFGEQPGIDCLPTLRMAPYAKSVRSSGAGDPSCGADRNQHRSPFADTDEIRMWPHGAKARIVGRCDSRVPACCGDPASAGNGRSRATAPHRGTIPVVGCAHATILRPPSGAGPCGTTMIPEATIGSSRNPVDR